MSNVNFAREKALKILNDVLTKNLYSNLTLDLYLKDENLKSIDKAFISEIVYGTLRYLITIDSIVEKFSSIKLKKISPWIMNILRMGIYQIIYMRVPVSAAVNESVKLSKKFGHSKSSGFVNAVLRNVSKSYEGLIFDSYEKTYSFPKWMIDKWIEELGEEFTLSLMDSLNLRPDITIRANTLKISLEDFLSKMKEDNVELLKGKYLNEAFVLKGANIENLDSFKNGFFYVQDESSMICVKALNPKENESILDVCASPGGKSTYIAQLMNNLGKLVSCDIYSHRLKLIEENFDRLGIKIGEILNKDGSKFEESFHGSFDKVLVDAPCLGLGIIRKKPEIKWARKLQDISEINKVQYDILSNASRYVKVGGTLIYSTCSLLKEENENIVERFLKDNGENFKKASLKGLIPINVDEEDFCITLYPNVHNTDGFFIARMIRIS